MTGIKLCMRGTASGKKETQWGTTIFNFGKRTAPRSFSTFISGSSAGSPK